MAVNKANKFFKLSCLILTLASIWFSIGFKGGKAYFKIGLYERPILFSEASNDDSGSSDSTDSDFA